MTDDRTAPLHRNDTPGDSLRRIRLRLGLSTRKVSELSHRVAAQQGNPEYSISHGRMVQIENDGSAPGLYKLFTLSSVYGISLQKLISLFLNLDAAEQLHTALGLQHTHMAAFDASTKKTIPFPAHLATTSRTADPAVGDSLTAAWGEVPVPLIQHLNMPQSRYGLIGLSDYTMYPLIPPGSVVQLEDCQKVAKPVPYRTELERPIYFLESREGYVCSWCEVSRGQLFSIPHPLSPCRPQAFPFPSEIDVIGRVTGVALRFEREAARAGEQPEVMPAAAPYRGRATAG
jgi:transcriptional regulator with XRE-family HTH domain